MTRFQCRECARPADPRDAECFNCGVTRPAVWRRSRLRDATDVVTASATFAFVLAVGAAVAAARRLRA